MGNLNWNYVSFDFFGQPGSDNVVRYRCNLSHGEMEEFKRNNIFSSAARSSKAAKKFCFVGIMYENKIEGLIL